MSGEPSAVGRWWLGRRSTSRNRVSLVLQILSIVAGVVAAYLWFRSATGPVPEIVTYWDKAPLTDPFYQSIVQGSRLNRCSAAWTAASVLLSALSEVASWFGPTIP